MFLQIQIIINCRWNPENEYRTGTGTYLWRSSVEEPSAYLMVIRSPGALIFYDFILIMSSVSDPHKFSCGSGSRILKMSIWIRIQTPNFYSDPDPKEVKIKENNLYQQIFN